jgi:methionyl-tRNA synthetase
MMALGEPLPKTIFGTGWLLSDGGKMSKSKGNSIDPAELVKKYGVDAVRYFLNREIVLGQDGNYTEEALINRLNSDLANDLGNLLSRTAGMAEKYFNGQIPDAHKETSFDAALIESSQRAVQKAGELMDRMAFSEALSEIWAMVRRANKYVDETEPWLLHRSKETEALARVLYMLCETLRHAAVLISPVMPDTSAEIFRQLGIWDAKLKTWGSLVFGNLPHKIKIEKGDALFPRIDVKAALGEKEEPSKAAESKPQITIDDFGKLDLRVGIIKECVKVSEKLLKSQVDIGGEVRQILSGIAEWYAPEDMAGKRVVVITNLKPIKLRGFVSEGMLLAAGEGTANDPVKVVSVDGEPPAGTVVR